MKATMARKGRLALLAIAAATCMGAAKPQVGEPAPPLEMTMIDGTKLSLAQLRGQVVVLNFWATWCGPCKTELPLLDAYYVAQRQHGLRVFAVTTESSVPISQLKKLFAILRLTPLRSIKGKYAPINNSIPTNYVFDRSGRLRFAKAGALDLDDLNNELVPLLREPLPGDAGQTSL
jgi:thiol-disulfide isomerase/thioredoxin